MAFAGYGWYSSKNESKWTVTLIGLRRVETGLGGDEDGVFWVDEGVANPSLPL